MLAGYESVAVADVDLDSEHPVRLAGIGAVDTTPMEVGSMTKAMTGLVIADAVRRGEIRMDAPVSMYLPRAGGSPAGTVTMHELVTHSSGDRRVRKQHPSPGSVESPTGSELLHEPTSPQMSQRGPCAGS